MQADDSTLPLWPGAPHLPLQRGEVLGRYFILHELGRGGMGVVYTAYDPELDRKVALKLLHPDRAGRRDGKAREVGQARLLREAQALARLSHPNVIQVYDAGTIGDRVFVAMELVEGEPLDAWLRRESRQPRNWRQILGVFQAAGRGLAAAHAAGLVHRDFKPANVLLGHDGRVRVLDFGIARTVFEEEEPELPELPEGSAGDGQRVRLTTPLTRAGVVLGTPRYMAPETFLGRRAGPQADQFAFCVALFEAFYGIAPYAGNTLAALLEEIAAGRVQEAPATPATPATPANSRVPSWLRRILLRGLDAEPERRYPTMEALLDDLAVDRTARLRKQAGAAAAAVLVVAAAGLALYGTGQRQDQLCKGAEARLAGLWDAGRKTSLRRAFLASGRPYAADAWNGTERALDAYTAAWAAVRRDACEATHLRGEQSPELLDLRMGCLDRRLREVKALTSLFADGGPEVIERAVQASRSLPALDECSGSALTAPLRPPSNLASRQAIERASTGIAEARTRWTLGRYAEGLPAATAAVAAAARSGYPPIQAEALWVRSQLEDGAGRSEAAEASLFQALEAAQKGRHDALAARAWIDLVWITGFRQRRFGEAGRWSRLAEASLARLGGTAESSELGADLKSNLGGVLDLQGDHARGLALQLQALALYEKALGPDHPNVGRTLNRIGNAYYQMRRYPEALEAYRRALEQTRRMLGPRHPTLAVRLGNIALVLDGQGRHGEALTAQLGALAIEEQALGRDHPRLSVTHANLASLLLVMKRPEEALGHARRSLAIEEANPDTTPADLGASMETVADSLLKLGRYGEAWSYNQRARALFLRELGPKHLWTGLAESTQGQILQAQGRPGEAVAPLRRALVAFAPDGEDTPDGASARFALARALWDSGGSRSEALALARQARETLARARPGDLAEIDLWLAGKKSPLQD